MDDKEYEICAEFETNSADNDVSNQGFQKEWEHEIGKKCFQRKVSLVDIRLKD